MSSTTKRDHGRLQLCFDNFRENDYTQKEDHGKLQKEDHGKLLTNNLPPVKIRSFSESAPLVCENGGLEEHPNHNLGVILYQSPSLTDSYSMGSGGGGKPKGRKKWDNPVEFVLSVLGFAIGLGNVWRFPYLCYRNGGGAFLVPYVIMLMGCGLPLVLMELTLGQYSSQGPITVWKCCPLFKGLGIGMVLCTFIANIYYNMVTGWALYYLQSSLRKILPWQCCDPTWATDSCVSFGACYTWGHENSTDLQTNLTAVYSKPKFAADEYYHNSVLEISNSVYELGAVQWRLVLALLAAWTIVFLVLIKGIKSLGKIAYFTSTFPFLLLITLFCRAVVEPGAMEGLKFFFTPKWEMLKEARVWSDAAAQG